MDVISFQVVQNNFPLGILRISSNIHYTGGCIPTKSGSCDWNICPTICGPNTAMCDHGYENGCWLGNTCEKENIGNSTDECLITCPDKTCGPDHIECPDVDLESGCLKVCSLPIQANCPNTVDKICPQSCGEGNSHCIAIDENECQIYVCSEGPVCPPPEPVNISFILYNL